MKLLASRIVLAHQGHAINICWRSSNKWINNFWIYGVRLWSFPSHIMVKIVFSLFWPLFTLMDCRKTDVANVYFAISLQPSHFTDKEAHLQKGWVTYSLMRDRDRVMTQVSQLLKLLLAKCLSSSFPYKNDKKKKLFLSKEFVIKQWNSCIWDNLQLRGLSCSDAVNKLEIHGGWQRIK